jgi:hypothetical protein
MNTNMKTRMPRLAIAPIDLSTVSSKALRPGRLRTILNILSSLKPLSTTKLGPILNRSITEKKFTTVSKQLKPSLKYKEGPIAVNLKIPSTKKSTENTSFEISCV